MVRKKEPESLSIRRSIIVWIAAAVLLWGLAVAGLYGALRYMDGSPENSQKGENAAAMTTKQLQKNAPAVSSDGGFQIEKDAAGGR